MRLHADPGERGPAAPAGSRLLQALGDAATYGEQGPVEVRETHASWVFLTGERAYKVKKALAFGFLDYSTLALRHAACREEVRVNRALAPGLYVGVRAIVPAAAGFGLAPERAAGAVEYAVEMRRFRERDTLAGLIAAGALTSEHVRAVARRLAAFHKAAPAVAGGDVPAVLRMWRENVAELAELGTRLRPRAELAEGFAEAFLQAHGREVERRRRAGLVRDGHGDLRCEHVLAVPRVRVVDRIEFDPGLRRTDVACDLAFLAMDLEACGQRWAAAELLCAYARDGLDPGSTQLQSFYGAHRALVRAKVALIAAAEQPARRRAPHLAEARSLLSLGERLCWRARAPLAIVICGPAASGKSTLAAGLSRESGFPVVSSDAVRKSAAGLAPTERAAPEHYSASFTRQTYERLGRAAQLALEREPGVIVDATCRSRDSRGLLLRSLERRGLTRLVVFCELPLEVALARAARRVRRVGHVSDATPEIVAGHYRTFEPLEEQAAGSVLVLDTGQDLDAQLAAVTRAVDRVLAGRDSGRTRGRRVTTQPGWGGSPM